VRHARHMGAVLKEWSAQNTLRPFLSSLEIHHSETSDVHQLSTMGMACFQWLRARRLPRRVSFLPNEMGGIEALLQDTLPSFSSGLAEETAKAKAEAAAAKAELAAVRASRSWRLTKPVRHLVSLARHGEVLRGG
jgi:hypothetical protein